MAGRVVTANEIFLGGNFYPISGPVREFLASIYPPKITIGDTSKDSNPNASTIAWADWRGGIGIERMDAVTDVDRSWWSTAALRQKAHLVLPPLRTTTASLGVSGIFPIKIIEYQNEVYAVAGTAVLRYDNEADSWGSSVHTLPGPVTDAVVARLEDVNYLIIAHETGYTYYRGDTDTWVDDTENVNFLTFLDFSLWGIDTTGQLRESSAIGTWTDAAKLWLQDNYVTDLFVARDAQGGHTVYAMTKIGLYAHDRDNNRFVQTELVLPFHPDNGRGTESWRDATEIPAGLGIFKYVQGSNSAVVTAVGPDRDHGILKAYRGTIVELKGTLNDILAAVDATSGPLDTLDMFATGGLAAHRSQVIQEDTGFSYILARNDLGSWEVRWLSGDGETPIKAMLVTDAYNQYRVWWAQNGLVHWMRLERDVINPHEISDFPYGDAFDHITPWFTAGQDDVDKLALRIRAEVQGASATETIIVSYGLNYDVSTWAPQTTITSSGQTEFSLPSSTTPTGVAFRAIRFRIQGARGATTTVTPDLVSLTMEYRKKLPERLGFTAVVNLNTMPEYKGLTPRGMRAALVTARQANLLQEFTYRDDDGETRNYYVDMASAQGLEYTGRDERGTVQLQLVQR